MDTKTETAIVNWIVGPFLLIVTVVPATVHRYALRFESYLIIPVLIVSGVLIVGGLGYLLVRRCRFSLAELFCASLGLAGWLTFVAKLNTKNDANKVALAACGVLATGLCLFLWARLFGRHKTVGSDKAQLGTQEPVLPQNAESDRNHS
jgi:hypothetical protein